MSHTKANERAYVRAYGAASFHWAKRAQRAAWALSAAAAIGLAVPAQAAVNAFVLGMRSSGTQPFDGTSGPGLDASATDAVVRTNDTFVYRVGYSLAPNDSNVVLTVSMGATALPGTYTGTTLTAKDVAYFTVADLPTGANGCANISASAVTFPPAAGATTSGVSADGQHIVCYQPGPTSGSNMDFTARVGGAAPNGTTIAAPTVTFQSANNGLVSAPTSLNGPYGSETFYGTPTLTVSAAPRWKVAKSAGGNSGSFIPKSGPNGEDGYVLAFNIGVYAQGSRKGLEALQPTYTLQESFNDVDMPNAVLVNWNIINADFATRALMGPGTEPTQQNGCGDWNQTLQRLSNAFDNYFFTVADNGMAAPANANNYWVGRGGTCQASAINNTTKMATLTIQGTDFSLTRYPIQQGSGNQALLVNVNDMDAASNQWWVANKSVLIWVPPSDLTPNVTEQFTNSVALTGALSVTGQANPDASANGTENVTYALRGSFGKIYETATRGTIPAGMRSAVCDPTITSVCVVNQAAPGQLVTGRLIAYNTTPTNLGAGYICDKIDNTRFTMIDVGASPVAGYTRDAGTGILTLYVAGTSTLMPLTWELGVGGNGINTDGTWSSRNSSTGEYVPPALVTGGATSTQATATCADADATWYASIAALQAAGHSLSEVTRVRARYSSFPAGVQLTSFIPLQVNSNYRFGGTDWGNSNTVISTFNAGDSTLGAIAPNQGMWVSEGLTPSFYAADTLRITETEYAQITKSALSPNNVNNSQVMRGSQVTYALQVNLSSTTSAHLSDVTVWDVLPKYVTYIPGSTTFGGAPVGDPACLAPGVTPAAPAPFAANSVAAGFTACKWTLPNQPVADAARGNVAANLPLLTFRAAVDLAAPPGTSLLNTSVADSTRNLLTDASYTGATTGFVCPQGGVCSVGNWTLNVGSSSGIVIHKDVSTPMIPVAGAFSYALSYAAVGTTLSGVRVLDVLPWTGDGRSSTYAGALQLSAPIAAPVAQAGPPATQADPAMVVRYTSNAPANINRDPYNAGHNLVGAGSNSATTTNWCTAAQFGSANCPANLAAVTAFMALPFGGGTVPANSAYELQVQVQTAGNAPANLYQNDFIADSPDLTARRPGSNVVVTRVYAQNLVVSGRVYTEGSTPANTTDDGNAVDRGLVAISVRMVCTGPAYDQTVTTGADGSYTFTGVTEGASCTITETQPAGFTNAYNTPGTGGTGQSDVSPMGNSTITLKVPAAGSTGNNFAEVLPPQTDMNAGVVCTPSTAASGTQVTCTVTCTNSGTNPALGAFCQVSNAAALPGAPTPTCSPSGTVAPNGTLTCTVAFTANGSAVTVVGGTGAYNDTNGGMDPAAGNNKAEAKVSVPALTPVPTMSEWALVALSMLLAMLAAARGVRPAGRAN